MGGIIKIPALIRDIISRIPNLTGQFDDFALSVVGTTCVDFVISV